MRGTWWRIHRSRADPLHWTDEPADGRWQRGEIIRAVYLADSEATAWAEWYRHTSELGVPPQARLPRDMSRVQVDLVDVADLTAEGVLAGHGVESLAPTRRQWQATQQIGEAYWRAGCRAVMAPSAAHEGGRVLCVFRAVRGRVAGLTPLKPARRHSQLPPLPTGLRT